MNLQTGKVRISKKALCVVLSIIMAFGTFITFTVGYSPLHEWLGIRNMLSAYAAEFVDTDGAVAVDEDAMLADDHTINLENKDGSNTVYLFSEPISYTDDNGNLKTKDISVEKAGSELKKEGYDFTNGQNDYRINFSKDYNKGIQAEFEGASYSIIPQSIINVDGEEAVAEYLNENFEVFQYKNIYGNGTNLRFYPQLNGVKDEIILNQNINKNTFLFELKTENCTAKLNEDGTISLVNKEGTTIQTFAAPFAYDSEYIEGDNGNHYVDCEYTLEDKNETSYLMTITVPSEWLNSANTKYPVTIDPDTINVSQSKDAGTYKKYKTQNWGTEQLCCFGYSHDYDKGRVYTQFTLPTAIKKGAAINSAYQWERECTGRTTSTKVIGYMVKASWSETGITWENKPGYNSNYASNKRTINSNSSDNNSPYWYKFNIKSIVNQWINGGSANYGITFRSDEEDNLNYNWRAFAAKNHSTSSYRPYTVINYTNDATAPTATGVSGNPTSWVKSATLKITGAKDNTGGIGLHSKPYSMSTAKGTYNWQTSNSFTVSSSGKYYFYVRDAYGNTRLIKDPNDKEYFTINKVDSTAPTFTVSGNPTNWVKSATLVADNATDNSNGIGLHATAYSLSNSATSPGTWKNNKNLPVNANGNYYIHVRDGLGNSRVSSKISVTKVDPMEPSYTRITLVDSTPKGNYIDVTVVGANDSQSGLHSTAYSFDGGTTWQSSATKRCTSAQTLNIRIRDVVGNVKNAGQKIVPDPTANAPVINSVSATYNADNNKTTITVDAEDVETDSEDLVYSYNGTVYGSPAVIDGKITDVDIVVTDEDNHSDTCSYTFTFAEKYDYDDLVGLYSESNESIQYRFDENDEWQEYSGPFEKPTEATTIQININDCFTLITLIPNSNEENHSYTESETDLTITNNDLSFDITRDYSSDNNEWRFSTETSATLIHNGKILKVNMPDNSNLYFVKTAENTFTDEINDYVINETTNSYSFNADGEAYTFSKSSGRLLSISDEFNHQIEFSYNSNAALTSITAVSENDEHQYSITENNEKIESITTPVGETLVYQYATDGLIKVCYDKDTLQFTRDDDIIISEYSYSNNQMETTNGNMVNYDNNGNYVSITTLWNETIENEDESEPASNEPEAVEIDFSSDYPILYEGTETVHFDKSGYILDTTAYITENEYNTDSQLITVTEQHIEEYNTDNANVIYSKETIYYENNDTVHTETVTEITDGVTNTTVNTYNESSQLVSVAVTQTKANGAGGTDTIYIQSTAYTYFENSNTVHTKTVTETMDDNTTTTVVTYNSSDKIVIESVTLSGKTTETSYEYDIWGNRHKETVNVTEHDEVTDETRVIYEAIVFYEYDALNRCIKETVTADNETETMLYAYNPLDDIIYERVGTEVTRTLYDKYGRVIQEIEPHDYAIANATDGIVDDNNGCLTGSDSYSNPNVGHRYVYDINTRLLTQEINRLEVVTDYTYHPNTSVVATESFDIYRYEYNTDGNLTDIFVANTNPAYAHYVYDTDKNNTEIHYGNGQTVYYSYDSNKNVTAQSYTGRNETTPVTQFTYTYNTDNKLTSKTDCINHRRTDYSGNSVSVYDTSGNSDVLLYSYANTEENTSTNTPATAQNNYAGNTLDVTYGENSNQYKLNNNDVFSINSTYTNDVLSSTVINSPSNQAAISKSYTYDNDNNITGLTVNNTHISYVYDDDKITEYHQGNDVVYYHYDNKNQLVREDINYSNYSKTITYTYDTRGNLTKKKEYPYTRNENPGTPLETNELDFEYEDELWLDEIVTTPTETILYDENGNPVNLEDCTLEWTNGRQLKSVSSGNDVILEYTYDDNGIRTSKTYQGVTTYYCTENGIITSQYQLDSSGNKENEVIFVYDNGSLVSAYYDSAMYYYITNAMGDVISIIDESGNTVVDYCYDAWGNIVDKVVNTTLTTNFADVNPMLFCSYYYDEDLGVYYLQSRYYKSDWCRFINSDFPTYALEQKDESNGLNLFAYCGNEPVNNCDPTGHKSKKKKKRKKVDITYDLTIKMLTNADQFYNYATGKIDSALKSGDIKKDFKKLNSAMVKILKYFVNKSKTNGDWDLKNVWPIISGKNKNNIFIYDGEELKNDDVGNIHFGFVGYLLFSLNVLKAGAGLYQIKSGTSKFEYAFYCGDDPRDAKRITEGYNLAKDSDIPKIKSYLNKKLKEYPKYVWKIMTLE